MFLGQLLKSVEKKYSKINVKGIAYDTRKIKIGEIFFSIKGNKTSGKKFIKNAILKGASAIVCDEKIINKNIKVPIVKVKNTRRSLAEACSNLYKNKPKKIIAVTGTNGKSSVVNFFYQILNLCGVSAASIGTLGIISKHYNKKTDLTSPDPISLHKSINILSNNKVKNLILEASSHGLSQYRLDHLPINIGIFTNLTHDHLDYHKNMNSYFKWKMYLFKNLLKKNSTIITDQDNKKFKVLKQIARRKKFKIITISNKLGNIKILNIKYYEDMQLVTISKNKKIFDLKIPLIGDFQIKNLLMSVIAASRCGIDERKIFNKIEKIKSVPGRLECVFKIKKNPKIIIDFAHTPDALKECLISLKKQFNKEIIIVFGCGGDRDEDKRFLMGKIASKYCKKIYVTDDNPRFENPRKIRKMIIKGCNKFTSEIGNRKKAIQAAIKELGLNEILLIAGKGHEHTQNYGNKLLNISDKKIVKDIIKKNKNIDENKNYSFNYNGVSINSKTLKKNNIFFAIKGKNNDGHNFVKQAIKKGASKIIVSKNIRKVSKNKIIKVKNSLEALNTFAKFKRNSTNAKIIGITGSAGKTTLKNLVSFSLASYGKVFYSPKSYNNKFGVPLSLSNLQHNTKYGIFEIGMDKKGEIDNLSKIVKPQIGVITNIGGAHFKNFKSLLDIARAKSEIIDNISEAGNIVLNKDSRFFSFLSDKAKRKGIKVISFSTKKKSNIFLTNIKKVKGKFILTINIKGKNFTFYTKNSTTSFLSNILACIGVMSALNINFEKMKKKFIKFNIPEGRGDIKIIKKFNKKFKFIDESYNANPLSMENAIKNLNYYKNHKKIVFLSDMLELGKKSKKFHKELSAIINKSSVDKVFVHGNHIKQTFKYLTLNKKGKVFKNIREAYDHFSKVLDNNDLLMVKGSNATGLNQFSKNIKKGQTSVI